METVVHVGTHRIEVRHEPCSSPRGSGLQGPFVAPNSEPNTLSVVRVGEARLDVWWERHTCSLPPHVLLVPETSVLFVGAGTTVVAVKVPEMTRLLEDDVTLFWGFERVGECVLMLSEVDAALYSPTAEVLGRAPVEPPYEVRRMPDAIEFWWDGACRAMIALSVGA